MHIKKNDKVLVLTGKDKGKTGKVLRVIPDKEKAVVENLNQIFKHVRPNPQKQIKGGIIQKEAPIHVSNLKVICPSCNRPARTGNSRLADGKHVRVCKKCNTNIE